MSNFQEGSSRVNYLSAYDFTSGGTTFLAPYTFVKLVITSGIQYVTPVTATTDAAIGVIYNCPDASGTADVVAINQAGSYKVTAGGSISAGAFVTYNSSGQIVAATQTTAGSQPTVRVVGIATTAAVSGQVIPIINTFFLY